MGCSLGSGMGVWALGQPICLSQGCPSSKWGVPAGLPSHPHQPLLPYALAAAAAKSLQSCLTLWNPKDSSPPGSPIPGILQAITLEWVAISFSNT